ncbi:ATP-binding protein [Kitasatospora sp. NPDC051984]|uniref:SCO6881 family protein n=1 Tax=Kitasatospora sp. NPDC051984 TaxID=3364059 RepID=UPI0037CB66AF
MGFCDIPLVGSVCDVTPGGIADSITSSIGNWIARSCGDLAQSAADLASRAVDSTTSIDLGASWFRENYAIILPIGLIAIVATFCLQLVRAAWRRDGQALSQAVTGTISGVLFSFVAVAGTGIALSVVDALSNGLFKIANTSTSDAVSRVIKVGLIAGTSQLGWAVPALVALGCVVGAVMYWGTMVLRKVAILVLVTLAVFAGAGGGWEPAARWRRAWIEATAALIASKLIMTVVFLVGVSAIGNSDSKDGLAALSDILAGIVVMVLVLLCPMMTYKFIHWASDGSAADLHRTTNAGLQTAAAAAKRGGQMAATAGTGGAGAAATAAPQGPSKVPGQGSAIGSTPSPSGSTSDAPSQSSFAYPGTGGGGGGGAVSKPLVTRRASGPLITRPTGSGSSPAQGAAAPASAGAGSGAASPAVAAAAAPGSPGAPVPIVRGVRPAAQRASSPAPAGPATSAAPVAGPSPSPAAGPPSA